MKNSTIVKVVFVAAILFIGMQVNAQVAINATGDGPLGSAMLDVTSTTKGVLIPRMSMVQRNSITSPATGLLIYQTDNTPGFYFFNGVGWSSIGVSAGVSTVTATSPLSATTGSNPSISITPASSFFNGYLKKEDFSEFKNKVSSQWITTSSPNTNIYYNLGKVGIGTSAPEFRLHVSDAADNSFAAIFSNTGGTISSHGIAIMAGINSPDQTTIFGAFFNSDFNIKGAITYAGTGDVVLVNLSDEKAKTNIHETSYSLNDLMKVKVRDFNWKESNQASTGFVAQELFEVFPEAVIVPKDKNEPWMVSPTTLIPIMVKSIQDQQMIIKSQEEKIKSLEDRLSAVEKLLAK